MIKNVNNNLIQEIVSKPTPRRGSSSRTDRSQPADASVESQYSSLIAQAVDSPEAGPEQVQKAKELLAEGKLDTPENIKSAATYLVDHGI